MNVKKMMVTALTLVFAETLMVACSHDASNAWRMEALKAEDLNSISSYDVVMRSAADSSSFDWELLSAIAYQESRYRTNARSHRGAVGLMQIMPRTARQLGYDDSKLEDPRVSIEIALKLLHTIERTFRFPETMRESDRLKVILAAYNAGPGYILRVRKEAAAEGAAYNDFSTLSSYITREGTHGETVAFANKVYERYLKYLSIGAWNV